MKTPLVGSCLAISLVGAPVLLGIFDPQDMDRAISDFNRSLQNTYSYVSLAGEAVPDAEAAPAFRFASIQRGTFEQVVTATGMLQPVETVEVGSQLSGQIEKLFVDFNDKVHVGDPLAQLDQRTFKGKVDEARAALEMARADVRVEEAKLDRARFDLDNAQANKDVLKAKLENAQAFKDSAERNLKRKQALRSRDAASTTSVEDAETDLISKAALVREAKSLLALNTLSVESAAADVRRLGAELAQAQAAVPQREAILKVAEADLDRTIIRSPIDGVVVGRFVNQGQTLAVGLESRTAFNIAHNLEQMEIHARVDETDIGRIAAGQHATFTVDAYPDRRFEAVVRQIRKAPQVNQNVVTYTVVLATDNGDGVLLPGMTALVKLVVHREDDVLKVPLAALRFRPEPGAARTSRSGAGRTQAVWVRTAAGDIEPVTVTVGASSADQVVLKAGALSAGDMVAVGQAGGPPPRQLFGIRFGS
ncbi:MAG TPA: efflux RND transporter periplasmic adaptor subunit [Pseudolabrys sp.]|nr:efflux RND transporter periplasmic adaptor subunit [Pseudolabrys sp.]